MAMKEIPFVNKIGQTINPGDKVICIATGYSHSVHVRQGIYAGMSGRQGDCPSVIVDDTRWGYYDMNDKDLGWSKGSALGIKGEHRQVKRRTTLPGKRVYAIV